MKLKIEADIALSSRMGLLNSNQYNIYLNNVQDIKTITMVYPLRTGASALFEVKRGAANRFGELSKDCRAPWTSRAPDRLRANRISISTCSKNR